jgi:uncharacterized membrane protein (DUF2068 family)
MRLTDGLKAVAIYEAAKGVLVLVAGFEVLTLMGQDLQSYAEELVNHLHLNPAKGYPRIFIDAAANVSNGKLLMFAGFALAYAIVRWIEAYGLWRARRWAEWFAVLSGAIYVPAELFSLLHHATPLKALLLTLNVGIVVYMMYVLWRLERGRVKTPDDGAGL